MTKTLTLQLTEHEAVALSIAAIHDGPSEHRTDALESARRKIRAALDGRDPDEDQRYINLEC